MKFDYPKYIIRDNLFIGTFQYLEYGKFPVYRFPGGDSIVDDIEIKINSSNDRKELERRINIQ